MFLLLIAEEEGSPEFLPLDSSAGCIREAIEFRDLAQVFEKEGFTILGKIKDSAKSRQKF